MSPPARAGRLRQGALLPPFPLYLIVAAAAVALYVAVGYFQNGTFGFPLDDAWIHQVYARNLGTRYEFSFSPGQPSAGSTSPLWALLLSVGYALGIDYRLWTILVGVVCLGASGWVSHRLTGRLIDGVTRVCWAAGVCVVLEWHMVWAAVSGMEIVLFVLLALALVHQALSLTIEPVRALGLGVLGGLLVLTRPEGIVLVGLVGAGLLVRLLIGTEARTMRHWAAVGVFGLAVVFVVAPYVWFNVQTSRTLLPNTFYAKATEYASLVSETSFFARWLSLYRQPFIGAQLLLLPGMVFGIYLLARRREWVKVFPALWIVLLPALYAWRLPVEYQFGRYMMPIIPFVLVYGVVGMMWLLPKVSLRLLRRAWVMTIGVLLIVFLFLGAGLYAQAVAIINCEMVTAANWTRQNVPRSARIAAHDIGAQGYFDSHALLDLAGLVSPEVIPIMRDETKLEAWMIAAGVRYAIFFPSWYPKLTSDPQFHEVFTTNCATTQAMGEENLRVYEIR